jgi:hypothetical protein
LARKVEKGGRRRDVERAIWRRQELRAHDLMKVGARSPAAPPLDELEHHPLLVLRIESELLLLRITYSPGGFMWRRLVLVASMTVRYNPGRALRVVGINWAVVSQRIVSEMAHKHV